MKIIYFNPSPGGGGRSPFNLFLTQQEIGLTHVIAILPVEQGSNQPWLGCLQHSMNQPYLYNIHSCHFQGCTKGGQRDNILAKNVSDMFFKLI